MLCRHGKGGAEVRRGGEGGEVGGEEGGRGGSGSSGGAGCCGGLSVLGLLIVREGAGQVGGRWAGDGVCVRGNLFFYRAYIQKLSAGQGKL